MATKTASRSRAKTASASARATATRSHRRVPTTINTKRAQKQAWHKRVTGFVAAKPAMFMLGFAAVGLLIANVTHAAVSTPTGAIVNVNGKCIDNTNNSSNNNNAVQLYTCNNSAAQNWNLPGDGTIRINNKCLDTLNHATKQGTKVVIATCGNYNTQKWTYATSGAGKITNKANGQCVDIVNNSSSNGAVIQSYGCWNTNAQLWTMPKANTPTPPTVTLTAPAASATLSGSSVAVSATASDAQGVTGVQFQVDGTPIGAADTTAPYSVNWDTTTVSNATHTLTAVATNNSGLTATSTPVTVTVNNTTTTPPTGGTSPSGQDVPIGDLPGWKQTFVDDFTKDAATGSWGTTDGEKIVYTGDHGGQWTEYPDGWSATYTGGKPGYQPAKVLSVHDGVLDFNLQTVNGYPSGANPSPLTTGTSRYQTYGRYTARIKSDNVANYHAAWLLWPQSDANGGCAESDFPEADLTSTVSAYAHNATNCSQYNVQDGFNTSTKFSDGWHTYTQEWAPGSRKYYVDGNLIGTSTTRVWSGPERWQMQVEPSSNTGNTTGHFLVDWVTAYSYNP